MRIAVIFPSAYIGGSEKCMLETVMALHSKGYHVHAIFPREGKLIDLVKPYCESTEIFFYEWWALSERLSLIRKIKFLYRGIGSSFKLSSYFKNHHIDLVLTSTLVIPQGAIGAMLSRKKHVWYIHEFGKEDHNLRFIFGKTISESCMNILSDKLIVNSKIVYDHFYKSFKTKLFQIYYAVDCPRPNNLSDKADAAAAIQLVIVGRIAEGKRQEDSIKALDILRKKGYDVNLKLLGYTDSEYYDFLKILVEKNRLADYAHFIPFTSNPFEIIEKSDIALVCSLFEAFGRVTIEAMKTGTAVIASDTGASPEIIKDGWNGLLYKSKDANDLALKIEQLILDTKLKNTLAQNAYHWSWENFNLEKHGNDLVNILEN